MFLCSVTLPKEPLLLPLQLAFFKYQSSKICQCHYSFENEGRSTAIFCHQVAAWFPDMFCNFYLVKIHQIANNSTTTKAREKISTDLESLEFLIFLMYAWLNLIRIKFYLLYFIKYSAHFFTLKMMLKYSLCTIHGR